MATVTGVSLLALASVLVLSGCEKTETTQDGPVPPNTAVVVGDGDSQGDAMVAGTPYNATAKIPCSGYKGAAAGMCDAGVVRNLETGTYIDVTLPGNATRTIYFNNDGSFLSFAIAEADGTAAMETGSERQGDTTIATLGSERYEIPDAFVKGD